MLLYLLSAEASRADRVEELLAQPSVISVQVLNEFASVAIRKLALNYRETREILDTVRRVCHVEALSTETHDQGMDVAERYRLSVYDAMIVASALRAGCRTLYSEDLQHRQVVNRRLTVVNPFVTG